jgi:hypothetical protein
VCSSQEARPTLRPDAFVWPPNGSRGAALPVVDESFAVFIAIQLVFRLLKLVVFLTTSLDS